MHYQDIQIKVITTVILQYKLKKIKTHVSTRERYENSKYNYSATNR